MKSKNIATIIVALIILIVISTWLTGCSAVHKIFNKNKSVVDSSYLHKEKSDSSFTVDSSSFHKENKTTVTKSDSSKSKEETTVKERTTIKEFDPSGKLKRQTIISKQTTIKKDNSTGSISVFENAGKIDSNELKKEGQISKDKSDSGHVQKKEKQVSKEIIKKKSFTWLWWLLLIIPVYIIIRNWPKIRAFIKTIMRF